MTQLYAPPRGKRLLLSLLLQFYLVGLAQTAAAWSHGGDALQASANATDAPLATGSTFTEPAPFSVKLIAFTAQQRQNATVLKWATATEENNSHFEVEMGRSLGNGFVGIARVESKVVSSAVTTSYTYTHSYQETAGTYYYRLRQVDADGSFNYSKVIAVEVKEAASTPVTVASNPLGYTSKVLLAAGSKGKAVLRLTSVSGQEVYAKEHEVQEGDNEIQLPYDRLQRGVFILTVELEGQVYQLKVLKS
jgi:uncharacterized protein (DUF697 family)